MSTFRHTLTRVGDGIDADVVLFDEMWHEARRFNVFDERPHVIDANVIARRNSERLSDHQHR